MSCQAKDASGEARDFISRVSCEEKRIMLKHKRFMVSCEANECVSL